MADTKLYLADFEFGALEIPAEIRFGGAQRLSVHELVGGTRVIDAMGRSDRALEWSGLLLGGQATTRARFLDGLRIAGLPMTLTWGEFKYSVIVREFEATYQRSYQIPYRISCEVVQDKTTPPGSPGATPIDNQVAADLTAATTLATSIGDTKLTGLMGALSTAISAVSTFASAAQSTINSVLQPLAAVRAQVTVLQASVSSTIANVTTFGGVLPGTPLAQLGANFNAQMAAVTQSAQLYNLNAVLGRMGGNCGAITAAPKTITVAGGNLFTIAEQQYGDATAWTAIAKANGLSDPFITGAQTLKIPTSTDGAGGVLAS